MSFPIKEDIYNEFKSDRKNISYKELAEAIVCMANCYGGNLWIGIEDDGFISGICEKKNDVRKVIAGIYDNINGFIDMQYEMLEEGDKKVIKILIKKANIPISTKDGRFLKRRMNVDNKPECPSLSFTDILSYSDSFSSPDYSARPVTDASLEDLDPLERDKLRRLIQISHGDENLLKLTNEEFDSALEITRFINGNHVPTITGLLLIGREHAIKQYVYGHEVALQIIENEKAKINEIFRWPLIKALDWIENALITFTEEEEIQIKLLRIPIPRINKKVLRESVLNAFSHRDYSKIGCVSIQINDTELTISNPGGFVDGVTKDNILSVPPHARNPCLANALRRLGLVERVGRGVDTIFSSVLRDGRLAPSYARTTDYDVILDIPIGKSDIGFAKFISANESRFDSPLRAKDLIILSFINYQKNITNILASEYLKIDKQASKNILENLLEKGLIEARGRAKNRYYILSASLYNATGKTEEYVRQSGYKPYQCEQMIISFLKTRHTIRRKDVISLCSMTDREATRFLQAMVKKNMLISRGARRGTYYELPN